MFILVDKIGGGGGGGEGEGRHGKILADVICEQFLNVKFYLTIQCLKELHDTKSEKRYYLHITVRYTWHNYIACIV